MPENKEKVARLLLDNRIHEEGFWRWLYSDKPTSLADANRFMLGSILDYQIKSELAWENGKRLAENIAEDPEAPWLFISRMSLPEWNSKWREYSLHRFPKAHERIWRISNGILRYYDGDPRKIWEARQISEVLARLTDLGVGDQISRMIVGALIDTDKLCGKSDVKADLHVRRVLGRALQGVEYTLDEVDEAIRLTRQMCPINPWLLDEQLYLIGKRLCRSQSPKCTECYLFDDCIFAINQL